MSPSSSRAVIQGIGADSQQPLGQFNQGLGPRVAGMSFMPYLQAVPGLAKGAASPEETRAAALKVRAERAPGSSSLTPSSW